MQTLIPISHPPCQRSCQNISSQSPPLCQSGFYLLGLGNTPLRTVLHCWPPFQQERARSECEQGRPMGSTGGGKSVHNWRCCRLYQRLGRYTSDFADTRRRCSRSTSAGSASSDWASSARRVAGICRGCQRMLFTAIVALTKKALSTIGFSYLSDFQIQVYNAILATNGCHLPPVFLTAPLDSLLSPLNRGPP